MNRKNYKNDILLIASLLILCAVVWGILNFTKRDGEIAEISVDGSIIAALPLDHNAEKQVEDGFGGINTVKVEDGFVFVSEANCPDRICVRQGKIRYQGESIVCLPHKVVVTIRGIRGDVDVFSN